MAKRRLFMTTMMLTVMLTAWAQSVVSGVVTDRQTGRALGHVSVTAEEERHIPSPMMTGASC